MKKYCVLAPAGNVQALQCAVNNGADAVYLGLDKFNARMKADNFTVDNLAQWADYCHLYGVKVYVTLNTSLKQDEFCDAVSLLHDICSSNADGVIVTDLALMQYCRDNLPNMEVVASTQLNIHDRYGAQFVKNLGATTVVLSRESTYRAVSEVKSIGVEVECFIHGALCVCQSGQCLMSAMAGGNSGNRGLCAQPCRRIYGCNRDGEVRRGYLLSAKDMCGAAITQNLLKAGADVFKIEGRNRRPQYAGETSAVYSEIFGSDGVLSVDSVDRLKAIYNRGDYVTDNYLNGDNSDIICSRVQGHMGLFVGTVNQDGTINTTRKIDKGDGFKLFKNGKECGGAVATVTQSGKMRLSGSGVVKNAEAYLTTSVKQLERVDAVRRTIGVSLNFFARAGEPLRLVACSGDVQVDVLGDIAQKALKSPTAAEEIRQQLSKTGDSCYTITDIVVDAGGVFIPKSVLNALRRNCLSQLTESIVKAYTDRLNRKPVNIMPVANSADGIKSAKTMVFCHSVSQLKQSIELGCDYSVVVEENLNKQTVSQYLAVKDDIFFDVPPFANLDYIDRILPKEVGLCVHNVGGVQLARESGRRYICGQGLNIYNTYGTVFEDAVAFVYSLELTLKEISSILSSKGFVFVDGHPVLMRFVHCPLKNTFGGSCEKCSFKPLVYTDELGNNFEIRRRRDTICTFDLVNVKKMYVAHKINFAGNFALDCDNAAVNYYQSLNRGVKTSYDYDKPYILGRLFDKVN